MIKEFNLKEGETYRSENDSHLTYWGFSERRLSPQELGKEKSIWLHMFTTPSGRIVEFTPISDGSITVDKVE